VNGREVGSALAPPWKVEITDALASRMTVEVEVVPPLRNRLVGMAQAGDATVARFKSGGDSRVPAGLLGPVSLDTSR
jgi:hypothetical protein